MTPDDFVIWLRGFAQGASNYNITPKQWDDLRDMLDKVVAVKDLSSAQEPTTLTGWEADHTGGPAEVTYTANRNRQLLKTEPIY